MQLDGLVHPLIADFCASLGTAAKKPADTVPKTSFQAAMRGIPPVTPLRVRPHPKSRLGFVSRAERRRSIVGKIKNWRHIWAATGGYPDLVAEFAAEVSKRREAAEIIGG